MWLFSVLSKCRQIDRSCLQTKVCGHVRANRLNRNVCWQINSTIWPSWEAAVCETGNNCIVLFTCWHGRVFFQAHIFPTVWSDAAFSMNLFCMCLTSAHLRFGNNLSPFPPITSTTCGFGKRWNEYWTQNRALGNSADVNRCEIFPKTMFITQESDVSNRFSH